MLRTPWNVSFILRPGGRCLRPEFGKRQVELNRLGGQGLHFRFLCRIERVGRADQRAEHEREQERDESDDRSDHVARAFDGMRLGQQPLQKQASDAKDEGQHGDPNANPNCRH